MPIKENGNPLDRLIGAMKASPGKGGARPRGPMQQQETVLASMEVDTPMYSRLKSFPSSRKRLNVDTGDSLMRRAMDEPMMGTPPPQANGARTPARLRLSVSRKGSGSFRDSKRIQDYEDDTAGGGARIPAAAAEDLEEDQDQETTTTMMMLREEFPLTDRRRALFEPLGPAFRGPRDEDESIVPPPDFESASYPQGWVVGKKRKLVNVDVVESMRRIAVHEMNRKDREINGLNEQLDEDSRTMEHLQIQLQQERMKRQQLERENSMLQGQVNMLMNMIHEAEEAADDEDDDIHGHGP